METKPIIERPLIPSDTPSFGIEFEFLIAFLKNPEIPNPNPSDPRTVYFPSTAEDDVSLSLVPAGKENWASEWSIYAHIKRTLSSIGLPTEPGKAHSNFAMWEVTTDGSIQRPKPPSKRNKKAYDDWRTYSYYPIEVRTPAYYYSEDALTDIADFCKIMRKNYLITVNASCGLHVHIGYGLSGFELPHLRRLGALIEAFEPQLDSIHPAHRIDGQNTHCTSFRRGTYYQRKFRQEQGRDPRVLEVLATVLTCRTRDQFRAFVASEGPTGTVGFESGTSSWNFDRMGTETRRKVDWVQDTIEFRGHEGTLDPEGVENWTRLLVGLVKYTRDPDMLEFGSLLQRVTGEKWVKEFLDTKATGERYGLGGKMFRPVFGQTWCGLVDFLRLLGLDSPANYYEKRKGKYLENGLYTHWYSSAPVEYTVLGDGGSDVKDSEDSKTSDDSPSSDSSSGHFRPFDPNPNPGTQPGAPPGVPPRSPPPGAEPEPGNNDGENQGQDQDEPAPSETKSAPASSSSEEFPARPGTKKLQEAGAANNPPSGSASSRDSASSASSEFTNPTPPVVPGDAEPVPVESPVPMDSGLATEDSGAVSVVPAVPAVPSLPPLPQDSLPGFNLPPAPTDSLPAPKPSEKGVPSPSSPASHKSSNPNSKSRSKSTDSSKEPDKTSSEYEADALAAKEVLRKFWEEETKRQEEEDEERKEKKRQRSSMGGGSSERSERSVGSGSLAFDDPGPKDEGQEELVPWEERPRQQEGVENPASEEGEGLEYLVVYGETKLPPLPGHINYSFRTATQHSHLLNGTTPKQIRALAPNIGNAIGSRFHRRDREPSSPWLQEAPDIASMNPRRIPYPGPDPWLGRPNFPLFQARAQLADALYEEEIDAENEDGIWRGKGTMGETWDIQHGEPGTRSEKLRRMLEGLRIHDVSPSIKGYLRYKARLHGRKDFYTNPDHLFPPAAKTLEEFEKNDDDWWRFEVACMTMNDLFEKSNDADDEIAEDACEAILRIGGPDGMGAEYWPEGAQNPFSNLPRTQEPVQEDVSPHTDVPGIHFPFPGQSQADFWEGLEVLKQEEEDRRKQKEEKDRIANALREQNQKIMDEMRQAEEEMEKRRKKNMPPPLPPRSNLRPPPLPPRPVDPEKK
ncbi:5cb94048-d37f-4b97-8694-34cfa5aeb18a [Sclerotinia trifoliorum]|uniref:5cb94048-d37f-4b97-8694-34cfa5aeb18a n=1 Tax=Sclerotinia trifoliorum TaxID=28548 RepID=A0A8H2W070_9HELO|nr:5cb94048-d37f-4b97-8694-34cfa5aeb18a [Sclerotinia trifoliorum]